MIRFEHVRKVFDGDDPVVAVDGVDLEVAEGETVCLIGTSGSGKTTVLKMVNRLLEPSAGRVLVGGRDVRDVDVIRLRRAMGYVIQRGGLFPHLDVARNVGLLCELEGWRRERVERRVAELLELVGLPPAEYARRRPRELSGGQQQRVGIARALALDPGVVLMDEPFGALDPITRAQLHEEFLRLEEKVRKTVLLVTHDLAEAFELGDRIALMDGGRLVQVGTAADFRERPASSFVSDFVGRHLGSAHA
ncbi:MAG TPA: ATP-binding cassette domain-containing protein [Thermoanaerobaculia bacterium]